MNRTVDFMGNNIPGHGLSSHALKWTALAFMVVDHIGAIVHALIPELSTFMRIIGRSVAPIFTFILVESFRHTASHQKMAHRLLIFAIIAQIPYSFFKYSLEYNLVTALELNVLFTFFLTFQWLRYIEAKIPATKLYILTAVVFFLCLFCDWRIYIPIWAIIFLVIQQKILQLLLMIAVTFFLYFFFDGFCHDFPFVTINYNRNIV